MKIRIALALFPVALFSLAAKDTGCGEEEPIVAADAGAPDAAAPDAFVGDCAFPLPCPSGSTFSVANCSCVSSTPPDASSPDTSTGIGDCAIPEPTCPSGSVFSVAGCECVAIPDGSVSPGTCATLTSNAQNAVSVAETQAQANLSCTTDSDCVVANNVTACTDGCGIPLNQAGAAQLASAIAQINGTTCATFSADNCPPPTALPCAPLMVYCTNEVCSVTP